MKNQNIADFTALAAKDVITRAIDALKQNGMTAELVETGEEAKKKVHSLIPPKAEVMTMTSVTLDQLGLSDHINSSGKHNSVKNKLASMDRETQGLEMQKHGAGPEWAVGSVHAVTEDGKVLVASNTGSQLPAYAYGASHVIWIVSTKKIVKDLDEGLRRIYDHILPLESARARKAYGLPSTFHSNVSKLLIVNKEVTPDRIHIIFVNEDFGF